MPTLREITLTVLIASAMFLTTALVYEATTNPDAVQTPTDAPHRTDDPTPTTAGGTPTPGLTADCMTFTPEPGTNQTPAVACP